MTTAVVTGAAGFIGSNLVRRLLSDGHEVRGIDDFSTGRRENVEPFESRSDFSLHELDLAERTPTDVLSDADYVFHQAAVPSVPRSVDDPQTTTDANCVGTTNLLVAARDADVDSVVVASSSSVYGSGGSLPKAESQPTDPESPYALSKYWTEKLALQFDELYGLDTVALRYFNVFGPGQDPDSEYAAVVPKFAKLMLDGQRPHIYGDGEQSRDFTYIENVLDANIRAAESDVSGEAFNVATGGRTTITELVETLNDHLGTSIDPVYDDPRPGDVKHSYADISKAKRLLDYEPTVSFEAGLERTIDALE